MGEEISKGKLRLLYVAEILKNYCFRKDTMSAKGICEILEDDYDITAREAAVRDDINALIEVGYNIEMVQGRGYRLIERPDGLTLNDLVDLRDCIMTTRIFTPDKKQYLLDVLCDVSINSHARELLGQMTIDNSNIDEYIPVDGRIEKYLALIRKALGVDEVKVQDDFAYEEGLRNKKGQRFVHKLLLVSNSFTTEYGEVPQTVVPYGVRNAGSEYPLILDCYNCNSQRYECYEVYYIKSLEMLDDKVHINPDSFDDEFEKQRMRELPKIEPKEIENAVAIRCDIELGAAFVGMCEQCSLNILNKEFVDTFCSNDGNDEEEPINDTEEVFVSFDDIEGVTANYIEIIVEAKTAQDYEYLFRIVAYMWKDAEIVAPPMAVEAMKGYIQDIASVYETEGGMDWDSRLENAKLTEFESRFYEKK